MTADVRAGATVITLSAMRFDALIGVLDRELEVPQPIEVDLVLDVKRPRGKIDTQNILDYRRAYDLVAGVVLAGHIPYLEEAAERIASRALELPLVLRARVAVRKMRVALPGPLAFAEVAVERSRD